MKSRNIAALLAFFLGGLGVHKFYLGKTFQGIIYLVFCWTYIPAIIALIESIMFLLMSDTEFQKKYCTESPSSNDTFLHNNQQEVQRDYSNSSYKRKNRFLPEAEDVEEVKEATKKCPKCGAENDINNKFCESCGTKFD